MMHKTKPDEQDPSKFLPENDTVHRFQPDKSEDSQNQPSQAEAVTVSGRAVGAGSYVSPRQTSCSSSAEDSL